MKYWYDQLQVKDAFNWLTLSRVFDSFSCLKELIFFRLGRSIGPNFTKKAKKQSRIRSNYKTLLAA